MRHGTRVVVVSALALGLAGALSGCAAGTRKPGGSAGQDTAGASEVGAGGGGAAGSSGTDPSQVAGTTGARAGTGSAASGAGGGGAGRSGGGGGTQRGLDASAAGMERDAAVPRVDAGVSRDGGAAGGAGPGCSGSLAALCEDFESGAIDPKLWKVMQSKGTATLDASRAARGSKYSLHVHVDPGSDTLVGAIESKTFPALKAGLFARAFIFIPSAMADSLFKGDRHSRLIYAQGATPYGEYALGIWNGGIIQNHYSQSDDSVDTKQLPPFDQWFCLEYELDSAAGNVKAYLNDVEITALRHTGWPASNIDTLMFGVDRYGSFPIAEDIWFDDLVVDSARIGCTR